MAVRHAPLPLLQAHLVSDQQKKWCNVEKYDRNLQIIQIGALQNVILTFFFGYL